MSMIQNGLSGLKASQILLDTASNNIANVNTPGYSRQEGVLVSRQNGSSNLSPGSGVEVSNLRRINDQYTQAALWRAQSQSSYYTEMNQMFSQAEGILGSEGLSVSEGIDNLFAALNSAATDPQTIATRQQVIAGADNLAKRFNQLSISLDLQRTQITEQADGIVKGLNENLKTFAMLNEEVVKLGASGGNTSMLLDQRDVVLKEISEQVQVTARWNSDGRIDLSLTSGEPLVLGGRSATLSLSGSNLTSTMGGQVFNVREAGSQLGALIEFRDTRLADIRSSLDTQAADLADQFNAQLNAGYDLSLNPGANLFSYDPADPAGSLSTTALAPEELAFIGDNSGTPAGGPGDNTNLLSVIALKDNFYDDYTNLLSKVAIETKRVSTESEANRSLLATAQAKRDNLSAVNQDEEAMNLVKFTQAYQANAKVITTSSQIFETLLRMF